MNIREKLVRVNREIDAISGHDDADAGVVIGALESIKAGVDERIAAINARVAAEVAEMTAPAAEAAPAEAPAGDEG